MDYTHYFFAYRKKLRKKILGIHDLFGTELAMIFSFHVGLTDSVMQFFFLSVSVRYFLATTLPDLLF
jgi:hypothetical protein